MKYRKFGKTDLLVSEVGHGLWGMGGWSGSDDKESLDTLQRSLEMGCNFFDSAWAYGDGHSDHLLGKLIKHNSTTKVIAASKIPPKNLKWPASSTDKLRDVFPRQHVMDYTEKILQGIGINCLDVLQFHVWDDSWSDEDEWKLTVTDLKSKKLIRYFGLSINRWEPWNGMKAIQTGLVDAVQVIYNIFDQAPEDQLFPLCEKMNVGVIARVPLDEGGLTGKLTDETCFPEDDWRARYFGPENLHPTVVRANALSKILPDNMSLPEMALRFILTNKIVSTTIVGMRTLNHLVEDLSLSDGIRLPEELITGLRAHRWDRKIAPWSD
ncbi:MAG: aldo/keto reductase [Chloroflexi bacterium RBG_19FT_COMBO_49_13]|nr:MAG: aldo/keto reductase [Chloroflexi bacterium RBG_13_50_21]OGO62289.1 MAG: aldo/keto reductase [Chloroflexi bacterium RBG_19FT_COMBO_49_13]